MMSGAEQLDEQDEHIGMVERQLHLLNEDFHAKRVSIVDLMLSVCSHMHSCTSSAVHKQEVVVVMAALGPQGLMR